MFFTPAFSEKGIGEKEGHVDANGGTEGGEGDVALLVSDFLFPEFGEVGFRDEISIGGGWFEESERVGNVTAENFGEGKLATAEKGDDDGKE